jgi:hypothetical protein
MKKYDGIEEKMTEQKVYIHSPHRKLEIESQKQEDAMQRRKHSMGK